VTIPNSVIEIGPRAFANNRLTSVAIGNGVTCIEHHAFADNRLTSVTIPGSVTEVGAEAFLNNRLTGVAIPNSVTAIGESAFANNQLTSITIPSGVTRIENNVFAGNRLTSATIPMGVTSIGIMAFSDNHLASVAIPDSVASIDIRAVANNRLASAPDVGRAAVAASAFDNNPIGAIAAVSPLPQIAAPPAAPVPQPPPQIAMPPAQSAFTALELEAALTRSARDVSRNFTGMLRIVIDHIVADDRDIADFIYWGLENQLLGLGFNIIDRTDLDRIRAEQHLGMTGEIDEHTAVRIGHFVGASVIVTGRIVGEGDMRRLSLRALDTHTASVVGSAFVPF